MLFLLSFLYYLSKTKQSLTRPGPWLILFMITLATTFIGFLIIPAYDNLMSFGMDFIVSQNTKIETRNDYLLSWILTFIIFGFLNRKIIIPKNNYNIYSRNLNKKIDNYFFLSNIKCHKFFLNLLK